MCCLDGGIDPFASIAYNKKNFKYSSGHDQRHDFLQGLYRERGLAEILFGNRM